MEDESLFDLEEIELSESEKKWIDIEASLAFGNNFVQSFFYFLAAMILLAIEYLQFIEFEIEYSSRIFLDSFVFYVAFYYLSRPIFQFVRYMITMAPSGFDYVHGSFWHKFFIFRIIVVNALIYGVCAYYAHKHFFLFE